AEGQLGTAVVPVVDEHLAGFQPCGHTVGAREVRGPDTHREAEVGAVGDGDGFVLVVEGHHRQHGTEDLLAGDAHVRGDIGVDRGGDEPARVGYDHVRTADDEAGALVGSDAVVAGDLGVLVTGDHRPQVVVGAGTDAQRSDV